MTYKRAMYRLGQLFAEADRHYTNTAALYLKNAVLKNHHIVVEYQGGSPKINQFAEGQHLSEMTIEGAIQLIQDRG